MRPSTAPRGTYVQRLRCVACCGASSMCDACEAEYWQRLERRLKTNTQQDMATPAAINSRHNNNT